MQNRKKVVSVQSFDFDGCIFNFGYLSSWVSDEKRRLIASNEALLDDIEERVKQLNPKTIKCFVGSNRQSCALDRANYKSRIYSCFPEMDVLKNEIAKRTGIETTVDRYLLADTYNDKTPGYSFDLALTKRRFEDIRDQPDSIFDTTKLNILYAQIHKVASENPDAEIIYDFYDDSYRILRELKKFFETHPDFIPNNVTMNLYRYDGEILHLEACIVGVGCIQNNYHQCVKALVTLSGGELVVRSRIDGTINLNVNAFKAWAANVTEQTPIPMVAANDSIPDDEEFAIESLSIDTDTEKKDTNSGRNGLFALANAAIPDSKDTAVPIKGLS